MASDSPSSSSSERRRSTRPEPRRKSADEAVPTVTEAERWVIALRRLRAQEESRLERAAQSPETTPSEVSTEQPEQDEVAALRPKLKALERPPDKPMGFAERLRELWRQIRESGKGGDGGTGSSSSSGRGSSGSAGSSGGTAAPAS